MNMNKDKIILNTPDDWHIHLRSGDALSLTVRHAAERFARVLAMPNLVPPITTVELALKYRSEILKHCPAGKDFTPYLTLYLNDDISKEIITQAHQNPYILGAKLYPLGATTNSQYGIKNITKLYPILAHMEELGFPLLIHGEENDPEVDIFYREAAFIDRVLFPLVIKFPKLRIVLEHISTETAADFVMNSSKNIAATITAHHLLYNRNAILVGGIHPHFYCLPILKHKRDQEALIRAAISGMPCFFAGTDSAPHAISKKETCVGCAGIYTAHAAVELYAEAFAEANALDKLEGFMSFYGADFYKLPRNQSKITLVRRDWQVPDSYPYPDGNLRPLRADQLIHWEISSLDDKIK